MTWTTRHRHSSASNLHEFVPPPRGERTLCVLEANSAAVVIGSSQPDRDLNSRSAAALGVSIVRRHSGGGAVLLVPGRHVWVDIWLPAGDPLWRHDVVVAAEWLGEVYALAFADGGMLDLSVHRGPASRDALSRKVCFLGRGPGEVFCQGRKLVGLSQRRTRHWIRFQTIMHRQFSAAQTAALLAVPPAADVVSRWQSQVCEIGDLPILDLLRDRLPL